jgi:hypothetical protein
MAAESISFIAGTILSLLFSYIPGVEPKFKELSPTRKRLIMLGLLFLVSGTTFGLACLGWGEDLGINLTCDRSGALGLFTQFAIATIANQTTFLISPRKN